ncbi:hypothetical protein COM21_08475 [Bacillus toyonensis]|jgi:EamA domain-containing membrane protein RarD|uniref:Uncharacterized protein n=1 Tax=Bacillus toyonensis TaxID=155322 RepID=A0AB36SFF6_9BACI|nr:MULTISPECIES: hypothetical protein [Bacillus]EOP24381.1 hypothetical protein IIS_01772 [Bacillus cereus VD131]KNH36904.1 hypothetical protein ACS75_26025 [Bacillus thuringiensis]OTX00142.1 hypothetical protein BK712_30400 [Bacillus thuringiensis serovar seoulensis]OTX40109.1 hypothetical protein BK717_05965 [Bacillus thuringiensis serovar malayensis]OUB05396.1 hypothetical protein BK709_17070 [Bacillus thuringiensis serovar shandongiensis]
MAVLLVENLYQLSIVLLLLCSFCFYRYLKKMKRERKLTGFEITMYIMTQLAYFIWATTTLLKMLSE